MRPEATANKPNKVTWPVTAGDPLSTSLPADRNTFLNTRNSETGSWHCEFDTQCLAAWGWSWQSQKASKIKEYAFLPFNCWRLLTPFVTGHPPPHVPVYRSTFEVAVPTGLTSSPLMRERRHCALQKTSTLPKKRRAEPLISVCCCVVVVVSTMNCWTKHPII